MHVCMRGVSYANDTEFMDAFDSVGLHYPCEARSLRGQGDALIAAGKKVWASEDWWSEAEYPGSVTTLSQLLLPLS